MQGYQWRIQTSNPGRKGAGGGGGREWGLLAVSAFLPSVIYPKLENGGPPLDPPLVASFTLLAVL